MRHLSGDAVHALDFSIGQGEIVGITGLSGVGFESIPYLLSGARPASSGSIAIDGRNLEFVGSSVEACAKADRALTRTSRSRRLALRRRSVTTSRYDRGGGAEAVGGSSGASGRPRWLASPPNGSVFPTRPLTPDPPAERGKPAEVLLAKWLTVGPRFLILHEPTQAVDVGARQDILRQIQLVARPGVSVLIVTVEILDLTEVCDRILEYAPSRSLSESPSRTPDDIWTWCTDRAGCESKMTRKRTTESSLKT